jgi:glycogen debranching enzyme
MFSGWGVRTLAEGSVLFNPMSYHNGSVWPHDNAVIAFGLSSYGYHAEALKILQGLFDASLYLDLQRLPELFCGFARRPNEGTTAYPVACSPQAWAVGAVFLLLQASLQIEVNALTKTITFNKPQLPSFLNKLVIRNIVVGDDLFHFELYRHQYDVGFHVMNKPEDWEMIIRK